MTPDTWHLTPDTWHVKHDTQGVVNIVSQFQVPSSYSLGVKVFWKFWGKGWVSHLMNESISEQDVCRSATAKPGLIRIK